MSLSAGGHHNNYWWCPQSQTITHSVNYWQRDNPSELENKDHHQFDSEYSSHSVGSSFILVYLSGLWSLSCSFSFFSYSFLSFFSFYLLPPHLFVLLCIIQPIHPGRNDFRSPFPLFPSVRPVLSPLPDTLLTCLANDSVNEMSQALCYYCYCYYYYYCFVAVIIIDRQSTRKKKYIYIIFHIHVSLKVFEMQIKNKWIKKKQKSMFVNKNR